MYNLCVQSYCGLNKTRVCLREDGFVVKTVVVILLLYEQKYFGNRRRRSRDVYKRFVLF